MRTDGVHCRESAGTGPVMEGIATPLRVEYTGFSTFRLRSHRCVYSRSRIKMAMCHYYCVCIRISMSINNGAGAPAKSLRISRWRWVGVHPAEFQISRLSYPYGTYRVDTGLRYNVKRKIVAGACLYNTKIRTSIDSKS